MHMPAWHVAANCEVASAGGDAVDGSVVLLGKDAGTWKSRCRAWTPALH